MQKIVVFVLTLSLLMTGCRAPKETAEIEQDKTEANQAALLKSQPPTSLKWSLERDNINKRTDRWNDPAKVSYIYLVSFGKVMMFLPIKGKVSSVNSQITNPMQIARVYKPAIGMGGGHDVQWGVIPSPAEDGSYGTNGDAIFFFTTDGTYCEWNDKYFLCDKPLKLSTPPEMVIQVENK